MTAKRYPTSVTATYHGAKGNAATPNLAGIYCYVTANAPFWSPPTILYEFEVVEGWAFVNCTAPVTQIAMGVALDWEGYQVAVAYANTSASGSVGQTAVTDCYDGDYNTVGAAIITFPAGYSPAQAEIANGSALVPVSC